MLSPSKNNSIDLIEDCLNHIYRSRKKNLLEKARKFNEKYEEKKNPQKKDNPFLSNNDPAEIDELSHTSINGKERESVKLTEKTDELEVEDHISPRGINKKNKKSDIDEKEEIRILQSITTQFKAPDLKPMPFNKYKSITSSEHDPVAESIFNEFSIELQKWMAANQTADDEVRGEYADFLIDKYLARKLDLFESSPKIASIRKTISQVVEQFASSAELSELLPHLPPVDITDHSPQKETEMNTGVNVAIARKMAEEKSQQHKQKVKSQYETFLNMKKRADSHPDNKTVQQYTELNDDIKSLLSSIQQTSSSGNTGGKGIKQQPA